VSPEAERALARRLALVLAWAAVGALPAAGQTAAPGADLVRDLPASGTVWSPLETQEPTAILDRIEGAGLYRGEPGRFSLRGSSWTQNVFLLDGVDLTDGLPGGEPLIAPDLGAVQEPEVASTLLPASQGGPGAVLRLVLPAPTQSWKGTVGFMGSGAGLQSRVDEQGPPAVARFGSLADASAQVSGPLGRTVGALFALRLADVSRLERGQPGARRARLASATGQIVWTPGDRGTLRLITAVQAIERPLDRASAPEAPGRETLAPLGGQARWTRRGDRVSTSAFAGYWTAGITTDVGEATEPQAVERLLDGPVWDALAPPRARHSTLSGGAVVRLDERPWGGLRHSPSMGASFERSTSTEQAGGAGLVAETVDGLAARVWDYHWAGPDSRRHARAVAAWAEDRIAWRDRVLLDAGVRVESRTGGAEGAPGVSWTSVLPRVWASARLTDSARLTLRGGYAEYAHRLLLGPLAFGDPNAPHADVYRWNDANGDGRLDPGERGVLVARVGPGSPDGSLVTVDPALVAPRTREVVAGIEASPGGWRIAFSGVDRKETHLLETVNVGVTSADYDVRYLPDPGGDILGPQDDQLLPVYDRRPESFGLDRYVLTNPPGHTGRHQQVELRIEKAWGDRVLLRLGGTAYRTELAGANRGFRASENDQGLVGELYDEPNADTHASGRGFFDRAFTLKLGLAWRAPGELRLGVVARYQDGQPFGRVVVVPDLAQGLEAVPATPRGQIARGWAMDAEGRYVVPSGHRFTYTLTLDARIEKAIRLGGRTLALVAEVFNLLDTQNEVEENPVWGPLFRTPTLVQPPRAVRLGARLDF
jgi:hypothetical protein